MGDQIPDTKVMDTQEDFENNSQVNAGDLTEQIANIRMNKKRTFDAYQNRDLTSIDRGQALFEETAAQTRKELAAINAVTLQALQNAVQTTHKINTDAADNVASTRAQVLKHADVAADGLWTDQLNPVTRGAGNELTGDAPVNSRLASTASLDVAFSNISTQNGQLIAGYVTMTQALAASNAKMADSYAAMTGLLAQFIQNAKQAPAAA